MSLSTDIDATLSTDIDVKLSTDIDATLSMLVSLHVEVEDLSKLLLISKEVTELLNRHVTLSLLQQRWSSLLQQRWSSLTGDFVCSSFSDLVTALDKKLVTVRSYRPENLNGRSITQLLSRAAREGNLPALKRGLELVSRNKPEDKTLERYLMDLDCRVLTDALIGCNYETIRYLLDTYPFTYSEYLAEAVAASHVLGSVIQDEIFAGVLREDPLAAEIAKESTFLGMFTREVIIGAAWSDQLELLQEALADESAEASYIEDAYLFAAASEFKECLRVIEYLGETFDFGLTSYQEALAQACLKGRRRVYDLVLKQAKESYTLNVPYYQRVAAEIIGNFPDDSFSNFHWLLETMEAEKVRFSGKQVFELASRCADPLNTLVAEELKSHFGKELDDYFNSLIGVGPAN